MRAIKVLVVDDSKFFQELMVNGINRDPNLNVVAVASDPFEARDAIIKYRPDVMTLDIELPRMNGIEFLKRLMPQYPMPTVVVSALNAQVFEALDAGAVDFVNKPVGGSSPDVVINFITRELCSKIKIASAARLPKKTVAVVPERNESRLTGNYSDRIIAIGASTGGTEAIADVLMGFKNDIPGVVVVQHMPAGFTAMYAERLNNQCRVVVQEAHDGDVVVPGKVLIANGAEHMRLIKHGSEYKVECKEGPKVSGHCPSVDVLFESVAKAAGKNAIGIILTGMGADGANGLLSMKNAGAETIGQNERSCVVYGMPKVAYDIGAVKYQLDLTQVSEKVYTLLGAGRGTPSPANPVSQTIQNVTGIIQGQQLRQTGISGGISYNQLARMKAAGESPQQFRTDTGQNPAAAPARQNESGQEGSIRIHKPPEAAYNNENFDVLKKPGSLSGYIKSLMSSGDDSGTKKED